ncbi:MAG: hypothetical protein KIS63_10565 [Caldilineales bacterium]|nr:hypothetical protein [Caldilineales bacterium]
MSKHRIWVLFAGLVLVALLAAACGGATAPTAAPAPTEAPTVAPTPVPPTPEPTKAPEPTATPEPAPTEAPAMELMSSSVDSCDYGGEIKSIEAIDPLTVKFTLCFPDPAFPAKAADTSMQIQSSDYLEKTGGTGDLLEKPVGTGPYMLKEWRKGDQMIMEANPNYWGDKAKAQTLVFRWSAEAAQRLLELQSGNVSGIDNPGPDDFAVIEGDANLKLYPRAGTNIFYVGMNNTYPPFDNERVRQAFAMGIDRERIVKTFYPVGSLVATQFMPSSIFGYSKDLDWYKYDPEQAKKILTEEGILPGFKTTITYRDVVRSYLPNPGVVAQDIQAQLADIGIEASINVMESGAFLDAAAAGEIDGLTMLGWGADYPDATNFLDYHFGEGASKQFGTGFQDIWDALKEGRTKATPEERQPWYDKANELIKQHVPMIPIAHGGNGLQPTAPALIPAPDARRWPSSTVADTPLDAERRTGHLLRR